MRKCEFDGCKEAACGLYTWGNYPNGEHNKNVPLCSTHADELWEAIKSGVASLITHFVIERVSDGSSNPDYEPCA